MKAAQGGQSLSMMNPEELTADSFVWPKAVLSWSGETSKPLAGRLDPEPQADSSFCQLLLH